MSDELNVEVLIEKRAERGEVAASLKAKIEESADPFRISAENPEGKEMSDSEFEHYNTLVQNHIYVSDEFAALDREIKAKEKQTAAREADAPNISAAFRAFAHYGSKDYPSQRAMTSNEEDHFISDMSEKSKWAGQRAFTLKAAQTRTGAGSDSSGAAAVEEMHRPGVLVENMLAHGGVSKVASILQTSHGNNIPVPTIDATAQTGERITENTVASDLDAPDIGDVTLKDWIYTSRVAALSNQLIRDASFDIVSWTQGALVTRIARKIEADITTGAPADGPTGVIDQMAVAHTISNATGIQWPDFLDLIGAVDDNYLTGPAGHGLGGGGKIAFIMNKSLYIDLLKLADTQKRPLFLPTITDGEGGMSAGAMGEGGMSVGGMRSMSLFGYPVHVVYGMQSLGAVGRKIVGFGNFGYYVLRVAQETRLLRFDDSPYAKRGAVGFLAFSEADGRWVQQLDSNSAITAAKIMNTKA